jgi:HEAT repeat protein
MPNLDLLGRKLQSSDAEDRREATVALGRAGGAAVPLLFRALADVDWRVRKTAVEALVALSDSEVVAGLVKQLFSHDNAGARNSAIEALVHIGTETVDPLLASLTTTDPDVRKFIVDILGDIRDARAVPALVGRLEDDDENIRVASAEALGKIRDRSAVDALIGCLSRTGQDWLDYAAAEALGEIGDERALGPLLAALERSSLREPVLEALGKIGNVDTLAPLIAGLADPLRIVREVSIAALAAIHRKSPPEDRETMVRTVRAGISDQAVDFLEEMSTASGRELQKAAIAGLGWAGRPPSVQALLALLQEEDLEETIVEALKNIDGNDPRLLIEHLSDENALVRRAVARVLGFTRRSEAEDALIRLLSDENGHVRSTAADALGQLRSKKAGAGLLDMLTDEYENVQESAIRALAEIGDESVLDSLTKDFTSRDVHMRKNIALLLGRFSSAKAADALAFAMKDEESDVRTAAVQALGTLAGEKAHRSLMLAVSDDDPEVRMLAAEALGKARVPDAVEALISLLEDPDIWVRAAAARALGRFENNGVSSVLTERLDSASDIFLLALIEVLGRRKAEAALTRLLALAGHEDPEVRKTVLAALAEYRWESVRQTVIARLEDAHWSVRKAAIEIVKRKQDPEADPVLARIAENDQDGTVRQAAKEALEK